MHENVPSRSYSVYNISLCTIICSLFLYVAVALTLVCMPSARGVKLRYGFVPGRKVHYPLLKLNSWTIISTQGLKLVWQAFLQDAQHLFSATIVKNNMINVKAQLADSLCGRTEALLGLCFAMPSCSICCCILSFKASLHGDRPITRAKSKGLQTKLVMI